MQVPEPLSCIGLCFPIAEENTECSSIKERNLCLKWKTSACGERYLGEKLERWRKLTLQSSCEDLSHKLWQCVEWEFRSGSFQILVKCFCLYCLGMQISASLPLTRNCPGDFMEVYFSPSGNHGSISLLWKVELSEVDIVSILFA